MHGTYKIHDVALRDSATQSIYDGVMEDGILYKIDGEVKTQLREIPCWEHAWHQYGYDLCIISIGELFGYADIQSGQIVHQPQWEDALPFYGKLARVKENGKFGFINQTGEYVIKPEWDKTDDSIHNGLIPVCRNKKWGFVNEIGVIVIPLEWDMVEDEAFLHEMNTNDDIIAPWYEQHKQHQEVLPAAVLRNGKWGFIDMHGKVVVEPQFDTLEVECIPKNKMLTKWYEDKTGEVSRTVTIPAHEVSAFGRRIDVDSKTIQLTACPMYICLIRKSRWYRVQMGVDGEISILKNKHPKKNKDIQKG